MSMTALIPIPPPSMPISKAQPLVYPSSSIRLSITPPCHPVKDPNVYWQSGQSPPPTIVENYVNNSAYSHHGLTTSPLVSNQAHSPPFPIAMDDSLAGPSTLFDKM